MKEKQNRSTFSDLRVLIGLVTVGVLMAAFARYAGGRTSSSAVPRQQTPSSPSGNVTEAWVRRIDGQAHGSDHGHAVATDAAGNVLVTGWIETSAGNEDCHTVKYSPQGDVLWENTYAGSATGTDYGYAIAVDQNGNAYVAGFGNGDNPATFDIFVLKYDADGNSVWTQRWSSPITNYSAYAYSIAVDNQGNVFTTGFESDGFTDGEFITLKFNSSGVLQWAMPYNGSTSSIDYANCIVVDGDGNSYITGWSGGANNLHDMTTIKYDPDGNELWVQRYNGTADDNDYAYWLALDASGNVYVTGQSVETGSDNDITTIKYSPNGDVLWIQHYNGPGNGYDAGQSIAVDADGNAYVTGNHTTATGLECVTLKYSAAGDLLWTASYNGPDGSGGVFISIALDNTANAYVSGFVFSGGATDVATVKYDTDGNEQWAQLYDGPGHSYDGAYAIAVDNNRNVLVAGYSTGSGTDYDYTTIKYSQSATPTPTPSPCSVLAYITNADSNNVSVIDTSINTVVATVPVGQSPFGAALTPDGTRAYVANAFSSDISVIDTSTNTVVATVTLQNTPYGVAITPDGTRAYVTNPTGNSVSVIDTSNNTVVATVAVGNIPYGVAIAPNGARAYVTNNQDDSVSVIDTSTNTVVATVAVGTFPYGVAVSPDSSHVYLANEFSGNVSVIDTSTNTVVATVTVGDAPYGVAITPNGDRVYVANFTSNDVSVIDTSTNTVVATVPVGTAPFGTAITPDGTHAYVANAISNNVSDIDTSTNTVVATVVVGNDPRPLGSFVGAVPCGQVTPTPTPTATATATGTPASTPTATPTPTPPSTATPSPTPSATATTTPRTTPTPRPRPTPRVRPAP